MKCSRSRFRTRLNLFILSQSLSFVKNFFQVFSNFFDRSSFALRSRRQLRYSNTHQTICQPPKQTFLKSFSKKFSALLTLTPRGYTTHSTDHVLKESYFFIPKMVMIYSGYWLNFRGKKVYGYNCEFRLASPLDRPGLRFVGVTDLSWGWSIPGIEKAPIFRSRLLCWRYLSSRAVARQVLSAQMSLTSVFGMGTGGPSLQSTPTHMDGVCPIFYINAPSGLLLL